MSRLVLPRRFSNCQPQQPGQINRSNPIARALCFCAMPHAGALVNLVNGARGSGGVAAPPTLANYSGGRNFKYNGGGATNSYFDFGTADLASANMVLTSGQGATWFFWAAPTGGSQGGLAERNDDNAVNGGWLVGLDSSNHLNFVNECSTTNASAISSAAATSGAYTSFAVTWDTIVGSTNFGLYIGGVSAGISSSGGGSGVFASDAANHLFIGRNSFSTTNSFSGNIEFCAFFKRALSPQEILSLHRDRYQLIQQPARSFYAYKPPLITRIPIQVFASTS